MRRIVVFCCLCCFPILSALSAPRLAVPPEGVAFVEIAAGESASKSIELRNVSSSPVAVAQVKGCCGADAALSSMRIEPAAVVTLSVSLKAMLPGEFSKHIQILCDDPESPVINIPVTGVAVESKTAAAAARWTLPTVILAGVVDGFNPCSFAIMISLAGILAIGGRKRRARIIGGLAFCVGTFVTYMLMGLGLMQALKALEGLRIVHDVVMVVLALALFVLALKTTDAFQMAKWSSRNVIPAKIALGLVFALLGVLVLLSLKGLGVSV